MTKAYAKAGMRVRYLNDWRTHHVGGGEVHCGYRGDRVGLYTYNPGGTGHVDIDSVQYTIAPTRAYTCVSVRSGKVADVYRASNADGAAVIQWPDNGRPNQHWAFQSTSDGYHTITCLHSGKVLDVAGSSTADGATPAETRQRHQHALAA